VTVRNVRMCLSNLMQIILNLRLKCNNYVIECSSFVKVDEC
jgi:hypothetical protein